MKTFRQFVLETASIASMSNQEFAALLQRTPLQQRATLLKNRQARVGSSSQAPAAAPTSTSRPSLYQRARGAAASAGRFGALTAADVGTDVAIEQIPNQKVRDISRSSKDAI